MSGMEADQPVPEETGILRRPGLPGLAWRRRAAGLGKDGPTLVFLPGFHSDMQGSKAVFLAGVAARQGWGMLRFDYSGHGESEGDFVAGTIGQWTADALAAIDALTAGPLLLIGSSMGGWIGLNLLLARPDRIAGFIGIAAAPDFTERLIWPALGERGQAHLLAKGVIHPPSDYGEPLPITRALIEDGRRHLRLTGPLPVTCPVRLLQGQKDTEVPWRTALDIAEAVETPDVRVLLIKDGDHRLSRENDLALLETVVAELHGNGR